MKSIQSRLLLTLLLSFVTVWSAMSTWLLIDLQGQLKRTLDQRLAASARMVAGLIEQVPEQLPAQLPAQTGTLLSSQSHADSWLDGVACQVRRRDGQLLLQTNIDLEPVFVDAAPGFSETTVQGVDWRLFTYVQGDIVITTADRIQERQLLYKGVLTAVGGPVLIALIAMLYATWWGTRRGLRPLYQLREVLAARSAKDLSPVTLQMPIELQPLQRSLNQLLERIERLIAREKRFTSDAAHELRTPLTAIKTNVQLAQRLPPEQASDVLQDAESSISRMQRMTEQLLVLARLDAEQGVTQRRDILIQDLVSDAVMDIDSLTRLDIRGDLRVVVKTAPELLSIALRNLIENALNYSTGNVEVEVSVAHTAHAKMVTFSVVDTGSGLSDSEKTLARSRFWRGGQGQGSGLGLSITQQICVHLGATLELHDAAPGLIARIKLPIAPNQNGRA